MRNAKRGRLAAWVLVLGWPTWGVVGYALGGWLEWWTIAGGWPISWAMTDAPPVQVAVGVAILVSWVWAQIATLGILFAHWWWPAHACEPRIRRLLLLWGEPEPIDGAAGTLSTHRWAFGVWAQLHKKHTHLERLWRMANE